MKKYNHSYAKKNTKRQNKIRKILSFMLLLAVAFTAYFGWAMEFPTYTSAEVNVKIQQKDSRNVVEQVWDILTDEFAMPLEDKILALQIMACESRNDPWAIGDNGNSRGLWQIHKGYHNFPSEQAFDISASTRWAAKQMMAGKWNLWSCYQIVR